MGRGGGGESFTSRRHAGAISYRPAQGRRRLATQAQRTHISVRRPVWRADKHRVICGFKGSPENDSDAFREDLCRLHPSLRPFSQGTRKGRARGQAALGPNRDLVFHRAAREGNFLQSTASRRLAKSDKRGLALRAHDRLMRRHNAEIVGSAAGIVKKGVGQRIRKGGEYPSKLIPARDASFVATDR